MRTYLTLPEFESSIGAQPREIETMMLRREKIGLRTTYQDTGSGRQRQFRRENVIELAATIAFRRAGLPPRTAAAMAETVVDAADSLPHERREWMIVSGGGHYFTATNNLSDFDFAEVTGIGQVATVVRVGEILRVVDRLFASQAAVV